MYVDYMHIPIPSVCKDCNQPLNPEVLYSNAGYYVGMRCNCGPYARISGYYRTRNHAEIKLAGLLERANKTREVANG